MRPKPRRWRTRVLLAAALLAVGGAGVRALNQDEFAFLQRLGPRRVDVRDHTGRGYALIFPEESAPRVEPALERELPRHGWRARDMLYDRREKRYTRRLFKPAGGGQSYAMLHRAPSARYRFDASITMEKGECLVFVWHSDDWLDLVKSWFRLR